MAGSAASGRPPIGRSDLGRRVVVLVLDGLGIGAQPDAPSGDLGSNTLRRVIAANPGLRLPNLARLGNLEETVVLVELNRPIADKVIEAVVVLGASARPVGTESRHELVPLVHAVSSFMVAADPDAARYLVRVSPMKAGPGTIVSILDRAIRVVDGRRTDLPGSDQPGTGV